MSQVQPLSDLAPEYNLATTSKSSTNYNQYSSLSKPLATDQPSFKSKELMSTCGDPCQPCRNDPCARNYSMSYGWSWLGSLILWFIIFTVLFWLIFYSLKPSFVLQTDSNQVDTAKVLLAAVIASLILVVIIWLIKVAITRKP